MLSAIPEQLAQSRWDRWQAAVPFFAQLGAGEAYGAGTIYKVVESGTVTPLIAFNSAPSLTITGGPPSQVSLGQPANFSASVAGPGSITLQWRKNGTNISGATGYSFSIANPALTDTGTYTLVATNSVGTTTSNAISLTVTNAPAIETQPVAQDSD